MRKQLVYKERRHRGLWDALGRGRLSMARGLWLYHCCLCQDPRGGDGRAETPPGRWHHVALGCISWEVAQLFLEGRGCPLLVGWSWWPLCTAPCFGGHWPRVRHELGLGVQICIRQAPGSRAPATPYTGLWSTHPPSQGPYVISPTPSLALSGCLPQHPPILKCLLWTPHRPPAQSLALSSWPNWVVYTCLSAVTCLFPLAPTP